jgi:hypothetical protein
MEAVMTKVIQKTHPGTIVSLIIVGIIAGFVLLMFLF